MYSLKYLENMKFAGLVVSLGLSWASAEAVTTLSIGERGGRGQIEIVDICYYCVCRPTMCSMTFNVDHPTTFPEGSL